VSWTIAGPDSSGREESPDTSLRQQICRRAERGQPFVRRPQGNAPGNARGRRCEAERKFRSSEGVTESATENRPPRKRASVTGGRETCSSSGKSAFAGKGEKVG
jgi:hypothetical protein